MLWQAGRPLVRQLVAVALAVVSVTLSGCDSDVPRVEGYFDGFDLDLNIPTHKIPLWRRAPDDVHRPNSCMDSNLSAMETCSQHGVCVPFNEEDLINPVFFCRCHMDYCGINCERRRMSQTTVFAVSVSPLGIVGFDEYMMGNIHEALAKFLLFFLGIGFYCLRTSELAGILARIPMLGPWLYDIVRIGSAPVNTPTCGLSGDLPRWAFTSFTIMAVSFLLTGKVMKVLCSQDR